MPKSKIRKRKPKKKFSPDNAALYEQALDLYLDENKPDQALRIFFNLARKEYKKAYGEIGVILYREKNDAERAEEWFIKAEKAGVLLEEAAYEYGMLHYLEKGDWETALSYLLKAASQGNELAYGDIGNILYLCKSDIDQAEKWFQMAEEVQAILAPTAFYYGQLLMLERNAWEKSMKYFKQSAEQDY